MTERLPIDERSLRWGNFRDIGNTVFALGRDEFEGQAFSHLMNVQDLEDAYSEIKAHNRMDDVVPGPGINLELSISQRRPVFDHQELGLWSSLKFDNQTNQVILHWLKKARRKH